MQKARAAAKLLPSTQPVIYPQTLQVRAPGRASGSHTVSVTPSCLTEPLLLSHSTPCNLPSPMAGGSLLAAAGRPSFLPSAAGNLPAAAGNLPATAGDLPPAKPGASRHAWAQKNTRSALLCVDVDSRFAPSGRLPTLPARAGRLSAAKSGKWPASL